MLEENGLHVLVAWVCYSKPLHKVNVCFTMQVPALVV